MNETLRERYKHLHPLAIQRSIDRASSEAELFDLLDSFPEQLPVVWSQSERRWVTTWDILQEESFS